LRSGTVAAAKPKQQQQQQQQPPQQRQQPQQRPRQDDEEEDEGEDELLELLDDSDAGLLGEFGDEADLDGLDSDDDEFEGGELAAPE
jgi:hypothetical protein